MSENLKEIEKSNEINLVVGNDNGNSEHDLIINGKLIQQPNVYAKVRNIPNLDEVNKEYVVKKIEENLIITAEEPSGNYYIGSLALKSGSQARSIEVGVDNNKIESDIVIVNTLAQIAGYGVAEYYKQHKKFADILKVNADMSTSLPVSYYDKKNALDFANKFLGKTHLITVHVGNSKARVEVAFPYVKTLPEGVTATWALREAPEDLFTEYNEKILKEKLTLSDEGNNEKVELLSKDFFNDNTKVMHVSIGEGTTELPVTRGIEFDPNFIKGINNGVGHAIDKALDEFKAAKGLDKYSRQDFSEVIKDKTHKYYGLAMEIIEEYLAEEAEEILRNIKQEIQKANNDIDIVVVYGGGSILMRKSLEKKLKVFCDRADIKLLYVSAEHAVTLEVKGLYNFANSKIFSSLKSKYIKSNK